VHRLGVGALRKRLAQTPALHDELFALGCNQLVNSMEHSVVLARLSAHGRVAAFLLWFAERLQRKVVPSQVIDLPMSRLDIADFLGLTIESVSRSMTRLKGDGLIAVPNIHKVVLRDVATLRILAGVEEA
jgi:CRP/FNR family transcriptional regulator